MRRGDISEMSRRTFLAAVSAVASAPLLAGGDNQELAMNGGKPVRSTTLTTRFEGAQFINDQEKTEVTEAVESRNLFRFYGLSTPQKVRKFEVEFAKFMGVKYALAVTSGTAALHCALNALGVGPGDEVILPAWTWYSCYNTILLTGALPVFAEVDESLSMDPEDLAKRITPQTKVIMVVHLFGAPAEMDRIMAVAREHNVKVLEDSAQCVGGQYKGKRTGSIGNIGIYSFQINKMITAGEGGAVVTSDALLYERAIRFHDLGEARPSLQAILGKAEADVPSLVGLNYRMNEMTGAVMGAQLQKLETILVQQRRSYRWVKDRIKDLPGIKLRASRDPEGEIGLAIDLLLPTKELRDKFLTAMKAENVPMSVIGAAVVLPPEPYIANKAVPHPEWPSFNSPRGKTIRYGAECCPRTVDLFNRAATLAIGPKYTDSDLNDIVTAITKVYRLLLT